MHTTQHHHLLKPTPLLDDDTPTVQQRILDRGWQALPEQERIGAIYAFVRDEIGFGYNVADDLPASRVLGIGQCNTKGALFMALLRACGIPCRFHGFTVDKSLPTGWRRATSSTVGWRSTSTVDG